jgi:tetratricopeptide (TPR) repeat protein
MWAPLLLLATEFWPKVTSDPADKLLEKGGALLRQAAMVCPPPCRDGAAARPAQAELLRQAALLFDQAAALRADDADAPYYAAYALREGKSYEAAAARYEESRRRRPDGPRAGDIAFQLGTVWAHLGRFQRSIDEYARGLELDDAPYARAALYINRAESLMALGRLSESLGAYRKGIEAGEQAMRLGHMGADSQALHLLGLAVALDRDEQEEKGMGCVHHSLELDAAERMLHGDDVFFVPEGDISYYDALIALGKGDAKEAGKAFAQFLKDVPRSPYAARARSHLARLGIAAPEVTAPASASERPRLRGGVVSTRGPLTSPELDAEAKRYMDGAARCFAGHAGSYRIRITVSPLGAVINAGMKPSDRSVESCFADHWRAWKFRAPDHPKYTEFVYRLQVLAP